MPTTPGIARMSISSRAGIRDRVDLTIEDVIAIVGDKQATPSKVRNWLAAKVAQAALAQRQSKRNHLDRQLASRSQLRDELLVSNQDDQSAGGGSNDLFSDHVPAVALDQVELGVDFVRAIHRQVEDSSLCKGH